MADQGPGPDGESSPGVGRRRFLSVGGGVLAGAGTLSLPRPGHGPSSATMATPAATRGLPPIYPADPRHATMRMGLRARKGDPETGRLLWAHTGGGGNFGIVTAYYFTGLPNPPEQVRVAITTWPWSGLTAADSATLLRNYGRFLQANSSPSSPCAGLFALLHALHQSAGKITMTTQVTPDGPPSTTRRAIPPCRRSRPGGTRATCSTTPSQSRPPPTIRKRPHPGQCVDLAVRYCTQQCPGASRQ